MTALMALARHWRLGLMVLLAAAAGMQTCRIDSLQRAAKAAAADLVQARAATRAAEEAVRARDAAIRASADNGKRDAEEMASVTKGTCRAAFDAGYAARLCAPGEHGGEPGGVRDLADLWRDGAFPGAADLPGQPDG